MNLINIENVTKSYTERKLFEDASFSLQEGEKVGVIGINGTGKTTLLKMIMGTEEPEEGNITIANHVVMRYLPQHPEFAADKSSLECVLQGNVTEENRWSIESEAKTMMTRLGIQDFTQPAGQLSGGQRKRLALISALLSPADILLLDEPTNHLDMESIRWLETFLLNYKGAVIIVSHDRYFLDRVVTKVVELFKHQAFVYQGNYSAFAQKKAKVREDMLKQYYNQQREIKHQEEVITKLKSFNREKSIKRAESREKMLDKIERLEKPTEENTDIKIVLEPNVTSGNDVLTVEHLAKAYPPLTLFEDLSFEVKRGERVALIGNNGTGKTTILKIINQLLPADAGTVTLGSNVHIGYYDQEHQLLHMEKTIFEEIADDYPTLNNTKIRNVLAAFLFTNDDVFKKIGDLSGGERGRVSLAKLMLSDANFLILDEPTNHLDITSKEILESALKQYTGTVFFVSHDRYFINQTATRILELTGEMVVNYIGNYDYYLEKHEELTKIYVNPSTKDAGSTQPAEEAAPAAKADWQEQKAKQAQIRKTENALKKTEKRIEELETKIAEIDEAFAKPENATNSAKLNELSAEQNTYKKELEQCYEDWEELSIQLDG